MNYHSLPLLHYNFLGYFNSVLEMYLNTQKILSSGPTCSQCRKSDQMEMYQDRAVWSVNGKAVAKINIFSTCINNAFKKIGFSSVANVIAPKIYLAPLSVSFLTKEKNLIFFQTTRKSTESLFSVHHLQLAADQCSASLNHNTVEMYQGICIRLTW